METLFNEYGAVRWGRLDGLQDKVRDLCKEIGEMGDTLSPTEARLLFHEMADLVRIFGAQYLLSRAMEMRTRERHGA